MAKAKRARNVETLKQPSLCLRLRASYFYPDIRTHGSVRGVKFFYMAESCGTPQSKERSNREYKICLNKRVLRLLDQFGSIAVFCLRNDLLIVNIRFPEILVSLNTNI